MSVVYAEWGDWQRHPDRPCAGKTGKWEEQRNVREPRRRYTSAASIRVSVARQECARCPVLADCATWALTTPDPCEGMVAGGMTTRQRAAVRDERITPPAPLLQHGLSGWDGGCRCPDCTTAHRAQASRLHKQARRRKEVA